jgi:monoterpene epsilon-lactone hydrolase
VSRTPIHRDSRRRAHLPEYAAATDLRDPVLPPSVGDLHGLPPTLFVTSGRDPLLSATVNPHGACLNAGVDERLVIFGALPHALWYVSAIRDAIETNQMKADLFVQ